MTAASLPMALYRCQRCAGLSEKPVVVCPSCLGDSFTVEAVPGTGVLASWTTIRKPPLAFREHGAYDVAVVDLTAGLRVTGRIKSHEIQRVGDPVVLTDKVNIDGIEINIFEVQA